MSVFGKKIPYTPAETPIILKEKHKSLFPNGDFALTCANAVYLIGEKFQSARSIPLYQIPLEKDVQKGTDLLIRRK